MKGHESVIINIDITGLENNLCSSLIQFINDDPYFHEKKYQVIHRSLDPHEILYVIDQQENPVYDDVATNFTTSLLLNFLTQKHLAEQTAGKFWEKQQQDKNAESFVAGTELSNIIDTSMLVERTL